MTIPLEDAVDRCVELQKELLTTFGVDGTAVDYFTYTQDQLPYWTNRIAPFTTGFGEEDFDSPLYAIVMRLIIGHATEGYNGEVENNLQTWIPLIVEKFQARPQLQTDTNATGLRDLLHAQISAGTGLAVLQNFGGFVTQIGVEFTLTMQFAEPIDMAYS